MIEKLQKQNPDFFFELIEHEKIPENKLAYQITHVASNLAISGLVDNDEQLEATLNKYLAELKEKLPK